MTLCGIFYAVLSVFSLVTGLIYVNGKRKLNPIELSDKFMSHFTSQDKLNLFTKTMGWITFIVGILQGITSFAIFQRNKMAYYWIALGFTLFSITSVAFKLKGKINMFPVLKCILYTAVLIVLLLGEAKAQFFG